MKKNLRTNVSRYIIYLLAHSDATLDFPIFQVIFYHFFKILIITQISHTPSDFSFFSQNLPFFFKLTQIKFPGALQRILRFLNFLDHILSFFEILIITQFFNTLSDFTFFSQNLPFFQVRSSQVSWRTLVQLYIS